MSTDHETRAVALLWRPREISSAVVEAARRTRTRALFELGGMELESAAMALLQADAAADTVDLKISPSALMNPSLEGLLAEMGINRVWIELQPLLLDGDVGPFLERIEYLSGNIGCFPILTAPDLISRVLEDYSGIRNIALKGCEASGFVSTETTLTLFQALKAAARKRARAVKLTIWGGVGTPEAAAAFLSAGAQGIVFESLHWLTDLVSIDDGQRQKISKLRPEHTDLTGLNLEVPCRLFNRGNSLAVKQLKEFAGSLCGAEIRDEQRRFFARKIVDSAVPPLEGRFDRDEILPLGVEASFAGSFVRRYGSVTDEAIEGFVQDIETLCAKAGEKEKAFVDSPVATEFGTTYPFVQGAMSWITDVPEFALKVAEAGSLPTIALGLMDGPTLDRKLGRLHEILGDRPYAVNIITLNENPHREEQLAWIRSNKPRFAVIAAGEPSHARDLLASGTEVIYIAPNEELLRLAFEAGVQYVICEGNEAGGHVGEHSTLTLAQIILDHKHQEPALFEGRRLILAGGICNRETAFMAAMLGADAVQMGTCYLTTKEIVQTGALSKLYQRMIVESEPGGTVVTGEGTGLRIRSLRTHRIEEICSLEREFASGTEEESVFRQRIEALTAGSLLIAARGVAEPDGEPLDQQNCVEEGQFMSGACAGILEQVRTLEELHRELAEGSLPEGLPALGPIRVAPPRRVSGVELEEALSASSGAPGQARVSRTPERERIAITGMSVVNSLGNSPEEVWAASEMMKSGIVHVPPSRWDHRLFYDPRPRVPEKTYCNVGAFQNVEVSRKELGIPPQDFRTMTDSTRITMWLAQQAIEQSGILESEVPRERVGVLISQNSGEAAATLQDVIIRGSAKDIVSSVKRVMQLTPETEQAVEEEVKSGRLAIDDTTLLGRLNCSAGGFICNKYGFMGPSFSVSAACATALVALYSAYQMIRNGIIDAAIVGGAEELLTPMHFLEFSALGALSGLSGVDRAPAESSRPFDADRDGMVLGEGGGLIVIERESLARKRGAPIHAYITAMGASNNHLGMVESSRITQELALAASFSDAPYSPDEVDLVECHATSTVQGDVEEVHALKKFFNSSKSTVLTSFKSQIGHTLGASGINSLIRGIMAMKAGAFPPTLNYQKPDPAMILKDMGFSVRPEPTDWKTGNARARHFQVNAFGFGGSNYVVQLEQALEAEDAVLVTTTRESDTPRQSVGEATLGTGISVYRTEVSGRPYRLAVVAENEREAISLIESIEPLGDSSGPIPAKRLKALARQGLHIGSADEAPPALAFVFPGQGSHYAGMGNELYQNFPVIREWMDRAAEVADFDLLHLLFHDSEEDLQKTRWQQPALFTLEYAMVRYLVSLGIRPAAMAGHSLGELTALCLAGVYSFEDGFRIVDKRARCMDKACEMNVDPGVMMAVDAPLDFLKEKISGSDRIYITNINSPHQVVLGGDTDVVKAFGSELKEQKFRNTLLRVSMAFHSPIMSCIHDELEAFIATIDFHPPAIPVISNTTMQPFPEDTDEIKKTVMAHLESPVHWMQNVWTLWNDFGVRRFVEVGPRDILSNLILDSIDEAECIQTCLPSAESLIYRTALAQLFASGNLPVAGEPRFVALPRQENAVGASPDASVPPGPRAARARGGKESLEGIIQREINAFVMESFGRFIGPALLEAIRREYDPQFSQTDLDDVLKQMHPGTQFAAVASPPTMAPSLLSPTPPIPVEPETAIEAPGAAVPEKPETSDVTETVIDIIMEATGYERDEIEPEMDLREDLSIRSSRLPVIMDALETHFGIKIELEDFMDVRTIRDISDKISEVVSRETNAVPPPAPKTSAVSSSSEALSSTVEPSDEKQSLKRVVFSEVPLENGQFQPIELDAMESVAILSPEPKSELSQLTGDVFRRDYGVNSVPLAFFSDDSEAGENGFDLLSMDGASRASETLEGVESLAGMVFIVDDAAENHLTAIEKTSDLLRGFFVLLKTFLNSASKKFVILIHRSRQPNGPARVLAEGMLGMFLSLAHEFSSVQFRTIRLDERIDLETALRGALDRSRKVVETIYRDGEVFTRAGHVARSVFEETRGCPIRAGGVVILSGGAYGITSYLARSLAPLGCRLVFLGRTMLDPDIDYGSLLAEDIESGDSLTRIIEEAKPGISTEQLEQELSQAAKALEIIRQVEELRAQGIDASYFSCDVTDADRTKAVIEEIAARHGKIDGIIHGAGILKDNLAKQMTPEDFSAVADVKFRGAWNLYSAAQEAGLSFFACLSSAAAIQGNPGQVNYSAGNRMMSALMEYLRSTDNSITFKALMLPPIEGTGMADDPEIRALMKRMNAAYVHAHELQGLFNRELFFGPSDDVWVLFMRSLPDLQSVRLDCSEIAPGDGELETGTVVFRNEDFPMIDSVSFVDLSRGELSATRTFSQEKDLWISDHKPFKFLRHPLVSAIMALETFMEASRLLYPHLKVVGIRDAEFLDIIECPPDVERSSVVSCRRVESADNEIVCDVSLATHEISPSGQVMDRMYKNFRALVILGTGRESAPGEPPGFPVRFDELDTRPMNHSEVLNWYNDRSDMQGRYRILRELDGTASGAVRGRFIYHQDDDLASPLKSHYQYSPYLLEALLQVVNFYVVMRDRDEQRAMIPYKIGEITFYRNCADGENLTLEGRLRQQNEEGIVWDARAVDEKGSTIMVARQMMMRWFTP